MIHTASHMLMTFFTLALTINIFIHDTNLDRAAHEVIASRFNSESSNRAPSAHLHTHAEGPNLKAIDPREKKKRSPFKNHQALRKKRTQRPTAPIPHTAALAF